MYRRPAIYKNPVTPARTGLTPGNGSRGKTISLVIAEDHTVIRQALKGLLLTETDIEVVGEASNGREAVDQVLSKRPSIVLMDIGMPQLNGLEAARKIRRVASDVRIILLSAFATDYYIQQIMDSGIEGFILKDTSADGLMLAIHEVNNGKRFFTPSVFSRIKILYDRIPSRPTDRKNEIESLTSRETEVLQLIAEGFANKQIAGELSISIKTVEKHRQNLMDKLHIHETAGLTRHAISSGIVGSSVPPGG
ncbi:MAG: response regulator [Terrimicrobiaceae bacterium]